MQMRLYNEVAEAIPEPLTELLRSRRVIPFVGAGFSSGVKLPDWDKLLGLVAKEIPAPVSYSEVKKLCHEDFLQIAEYYLLMAGAKIGPIRHLLEKYLQVRDSPVLSTVHVELLNLGAPQIYTTNYDDLIERTFQELKQPVEVIAIPRDLATSTGVRSQVVKYHGDLRHEQTLVLTESSYYERLDFESPMDLKFRSDLLGRSVLFVGYSFRDLNIRIIWFNLMRMMKDVPISERPTSFIVRFTENLVLRKLYEAVGIQTIVLTDGDPHPTEDEKMQLLENFLFTLATKVSSDGRIPGQSHKQFLTKGLLNSILSCVSRDLTRGSQMARQYSHKYPRPTYWETEIVLKAASARSLPLSLLPDCKAVIERLVDQQTSKEILHWLLPVLLQYAASSNKPEGIITFAVILALCQNEERKVILDSALPWARIWAGRVNVSHAKILISAFRRELKHYYGPVDYKADEKFTQEFPVLRLISHNHFTLAYLTDVLARLSSGSLLNRPSSLMLREIERFLKRIGGICPSVKTYAPSSNGPPKIRKLLADFQRNAPEQSAVLTPHSRRFRGVRKSVRIPNGNRSVLP